MKRILALFLIFILVFAGCKANQEPISGNSVPSTDTTKGTIIFTQPVVTAPSATGSATTTPSTTGSAVTTPSAAAPTMGTPTTAPAGTTPTTTAPAGTTPAPTTPKPTQAAPTTAPTTAPQAPEDAPVLRVNYIDVGQGDSIFLQIEDCDILIDAGKPNYGSTVSNYLKAQNVDDIELIINTHPDDDHYGGLTTVLADFEVEEIWGSSYSKNNTSLKNFRAAVTREGLVMQTPVEGAVYTYSHLTITVLHNGNGADSSNDSSIVVMVEYGDARFLFTGDISSTVEKKLVKSGKDLSCDVLKVAHHGSSGSSNASFLAATGADYGVICVGTGNSYGHPASAALNRLSNAGIPTYRTDLLGHIVFSTDGTTLNLLDNAA